MLPIHHDRAQATPRAASMKTQYGVHDTATTLRHNTCPYISSSEAEPDLEISRLIDFSLSQGRHALTEPIGSVSAEGLTEVSVVSRQILV